MATYTVTETKDYLDGHINVLTRETSRTACTMYQAYPATKATSPMLKSERDARRWIDEAQIGGNLNGFLHELQSRLRRR